MNTRPIQSTAPAQIVPLARLATMERALVIGAGFVVLYILLAWITRFYLVRPFAITPWNPAAGLALAFLLVFGIRYWPALAAAAIATSLLLRGIPPAPYTQLLAPVTLTAGYVAMAALLRGPLHFRLAFDRPREIVKLAAVATAGTLLLALAYVAVLRTVGSMTEQDFKYIALRFWIGHLIGIVINTPLLLLLIRPQTWAPIKAGRAAKWETAAQGACVVLALWIIFGPRWVDPYKFFYLLFLPVIWIATRHGLAGAILGVAGIQFGLIVALVNADFQSGTAVTEFQFMTLALAIAGLFLGMVVTENRAARDSLARSDARLRAIVSTAPDGIVTVDSSGRIVAANPASAQIFGYDANALTGLGIACILPAFETVASGGDDGTTDGVRADGTRFPAEISIGRTGDGAADLRIAVIRDISRRVENTRLLATQQETLARTSRLAAAGEMAAALAHELHQPLTAIRNYARAAQMEPAASAGRALPEKIEAEAARAATVVQRLRDFFRGGISRLETFGVGAFVDAALAPMREEGARHGITLETRVECAQLMLLIDRVQVETVIHSLVHNAIEALADTPGRRLITVSAQAQQDGFIRLSVADTGPGIAASMAERMFEPFATTKASGTGMGLAISRSMIEAHGGRIWFDSPAGGGTAIHFTLPSTALNEAVA
jgi:two-component system sensor kinase FixL